MKKVTLVQTVMGALLFATGLVSGLVAQTYSDSAQRIEKNRTDLTGASNMEVISSIGEYKPGDSIDLHRHHGIEAAYVVQGASVQASGKNPMSLPTGATLMNLRDVSHGGFKVVGDQSLKLFTVHIVDKDKPLYDYTK